MKTKITHLIIITIISVLLGYMATVATIMTIPIIGFLITAMAQIMNDNFDITMRVLCGFYTVIIMLYIRKYGQR